MRLPPLLLSVASLAAAAPAAYDADKALVALGRWSEHKIAPNLTRCEVNGSVTKKDGESVPNDVRVRDVLVKHVLWSRKDSDVKVQGFSCDPYEAEGKRKPKGLLSCRWWFGEKEGTPKSMGWSVSLVFPYDPAKNEVTGAEIECVQVP